MNTRKVVPAVKTVVVAARSRGPGRLPTNMQLSYRVGRNIAALRIAKGWTQFELSRSLNLSRSMIGNFERAICFPSIDTLIKMADLFETTIDRIVGRT